MKKLSTTSPLPVLSSTGDLVVPLGRDGPVGAGRDLHADGTGLIRAVAAVSV